MLLPLLLAGPPASAGEAWWVFFRDKGLAADSLATALEKRAGELHPLALQRRARSRQKELLDERDIDIAPSYLEGLSLCGAKIRHISRWLAAASVTAGEEELDCLRSLPYVSRLLPVEASEKPSDLTEATPSRPYQAYDYGESLAQLSLIGVPELHACGLSGEGVTAGVLDTGFSLSHRVFSRVQVIAQHDFINNDDQTANEPGDPPGQDEHGTKVLSLLVGEDEGLFYGAAPRVRLLLAKVVAVEAADEADSDRWVAALEWMESLGAQVVTSSVGFCASCPPERLDGQSEPTTVAARTAVENGVVMVNSAGNRGPDPMTLNAPADAPGLIAVGSCDLERRLAVDSSRGPTYDGRTKPDVVAPGANVLVVDPASADAYIWRSGTSYAAPLAAGVAALLLQAFPDASPARIMHLLTSTASQASAPTSDYGWGLISGIAAAGLYCSCRDQDRDGHYDRACGGDDCDDLQGAVHPGAAELCNGQDDDCDGNGDLQNPECVVAGCGCGGKASGKDAFATAPLLWLAARLRRGRGPRRPHREKNRLQWAGGT